MTIKDNRKKEAFDETDTDEINVDETETPDQKTEDDESSDEIIVTIGGDDADESEEPDSEDEDKGAAPEWVKELRKKNREQQKKIKELEAKEAQRIAEKEKVEVGQKPSRDDYDYDENDKFEADLIDWHERKRRHEDQKKKLQEEEDATTKQYQDKLSEYHVKKVSLKSSGFDEAEEAVQESFSEQQQAIAIHALDKPELFMLAVGRNKKILDRLSAIKDPVIFAVEIGKVEAKLKTMKKAPPPETRIKGTAAMGGSIDKHLEKLEREFEITGDRTKILAYKRELRDKK